LTTRRDRHRKGTPQWIRLGELLAARRIELDPAYFDRGVFARARGINLKLTQDLENNARENFTPLTLRDKVAPAYAVHVTSLMDVLNGDGDLVALPDSPPHKPPRSLRAEPQRPHLAAVPSPEGTQAVLRRAKDLFPSLEPDEKARAERYYPRIEGRLAGAAAAEARRRGADVGVVLDEMYAGPPGFVPDGAELFGEGAPEADWWDGAKGQGQMSGLSSALQIAQIVSVVQAKNPREQENAGGGLAAP
jgi:hypothetical protein